MSYQPESGMSPYTSQLQQNEDEIYMSPIGSLQRKRDSNKLKNENPNSNPNIKEKTNTVQKDDTWLSNISTVMYGYFSRKSLVLTPKKHINETNIITRRKTSFAVRYITIIITVTNVRAQ
jgi:hypothetical protein